MTAPVTSDLLDKSYLDDFAIPAPLADILNQPSILEEFLMPSDNVLSYLLISDELLCPSHSILNLPTISEELRNPLLSDDFYSSYEQLIHILDFPVVQPEITKEQLKNRIDHMDIERISKTTSVVSNMVESSSIEKTIKSKILKKLSEVAEEILIGTISGVLSGIILLLLGLSNTNN